MKTLELCLPWFPGFYESSLDYLMDREIENEMEGNEPDRPARTYEEIEPELNYAAARLAICKDWLEGFNDETGLHLEMKSLDSPREYNFMTDRLFVLMPLEDLRTIAKARKTKAFRELVKETFTRRDGFIPFYPDDADAWRGPTAKWDHNELMVLMEAWLIHSGWRQERLENHCLEYCNESCQALWTPKHVTA